MIDRVVVPEMDAILGKKFPVLDKGFIVPIDYMGTDASIVQAARVSYGKGTKKVSEDRGLIRYLMRNRHTTPFEMCELKLLVQIPMDAHRQFVRHRTASINEYSTRYSEAIDEKQKTEASQWRSQSKSNKQGSGEYISLDDGIHLTAEESQFHAFAEMVYRSRLEKGVAREQARKDLPLSTYTKLYWKIDLHNLFHFLSLRMDSHAQLEIRSYANVIGKEIVAKWVPMAWEAFVDYRLNGMFLTSIDQKVISHMLESRSDVTAVAPEWFDRKEDGSLKRNRERDECAAKLRRLGVRVPWES